MANCHGSSNRKQHRHRHQGAAKAPAQVQFSDRHRRLVLVGNPNVGKSVIFNALTGAYVTVSNYPGTTVEVTHGHLSVDNVVFDVIDTPGMYDLIPITEEERVTRTLLLNERPDVVVHVVDAKNLDRMLPLTLQLIEADLPLILAVNMLDEAKATGLSINLGLLESRLGIPVVGTISTQNVGLDELKQAIVQYHRSCHCAGGASVQHSIYDPEITAALNQISSLLERDYQVSKRTIAMLLLAGDEEITRQIGETEANAAEINRLVAQTAANYGQPLNFILAMQRQAAVQAIVDEAVSETGNGHARWVHLLNQATINPWTGIPLLLLVLYFGLYKFVGEFGAGTIVDLIEANMFEERINPWVNNFVENLIPWPLWQNLLVHDYGIITLGIRYAVAIILPIVGTFFLAFSIIEDSGYLPRIALLLDRVFKRMGLNGRAVIPMTLGFGCGTMATMVTRTLETRRERLLATILLALAIPCSAQLGVILGLLSGAPRALALWAVLMVGVLLLVGFLATKVIPGEQPGFCLEVPPLRLPKLSNIVSKTLTRMQWYFLEVLPLFVLASVIIWAADLIGLFDWLINAITPLVQALGLPAEVAVAFLFGFFRRDYGAAGLYDLQQAGTLTTNQLLVAAITLTLFVPCIAQFAMMWKERGWKVAVGIIAFVIPFAFTVGYLLNLILTTFGVVL
ncbi:MAG: ferrous iron transport protein B [Firmicutes bacterium]|nr:ferrous iron transport protein B [Bacillota bacterium]